MKKDCRHLRLAPTVGEHKTRIGTYQHTSTMLSETRGRLNQMGGCFEAELKFRKITRKLKDHFFDYEEVVYETEK